MRCQCQPRHSFFVRGNERTRLDKMPKRSAQEKLDHYEKKIRKLMKKKDTVQRRRIRCLDSSDDEIITGM